MRTKDLGQGRRQTKIWFLGVIVVVAVSVTAFGDPISGSNEPTFVSAVDDWLEDDDATSLLVLSRLANEGNVAARLLLGRIEITDRGPSAYVLQLSRAQRLELYRPPGTGIFRPTWLRIEAEQGNTLAQALEGGTTLGLNIMAIETLLAVGEDEAIEHLVRKIAVDGSESDRQELAALLPKNSELAPYLYAFQHAHDGYTPGVTALGHMLRTIGLESKDLRSDPDALVAATHVELGYQAGDLTPDFRPDNSFFHSVTEWVLSSTAALPLARLCQSNCNNREIRNCAATALGLAGGYYEVTRFDSPLEKIIPQQKFLESTRARNMALRRIALAKTEATEDIFTYDELIAKSNCLANAIMTQRGLVE